MERAVRTDAEQPQANGAFDPLECEQAVAAAGIGTWARNLSSDAVSICVNMALLLGLPPSTRHLSGDAWRRNILPDDLPGVEQAVAEAFKGDGHFNFEFRIRRPSGEVIWIQTQGTVFFDDAGKPVRMRGISIDATEKMLAFERVHASEMRFRQLAEACPDGILVHVNEKYVYVNPAALRMLGLPHENAVLGRSPRDFLSPAYYDSVRARWGELGKGESIPPFTLAFRRADGSTALAGPGGQRIVCLGEPAIQVIARDVTEQRRTQEKLRIMNERLALAVAGAGEGIWDWDLVGDMFELSGGMQAILGCMADTGPHAKAEWEALIHADDLQRMHAAVEAHLDGRTPRYECEYRIRAEDGAWKWVVSRGVVVTRDATGKPTGMTGTLSDITASKEAQETIWRHANLDPLTGLPNRRYFMDKLDAALRDFARRPGSHALLFVDLDGFKQVNDLYGHEAGDQLLMEVAHRLCQSVRDTDVVARLGGDEFTMLLRGHAANHQLAYICQQLLDRLSRPFGIASDAVQISASIGVAIAPSDATTADDLVRKADLAMYAAKSLGKNQFSYFMPEMDDRAHQRLRISGELRRALSAGQLSLHFQPVVDLRTGMLAKTEALLRWTHPTMGSVEPSVFIPIAEEAGLMPDLGNWVFREAATWAKHWSMRTGCTFEVAVNKSPAQFGRRALETDWLDYLKDLELPPSSIVVEITEGLLLNVAPQVNEKLLKYRDAGVQVAIDDFGTGYSSMAYLQKFDIDYLKIDQSFVRGIPAHRGNSTIAETIIVMAHKLGQKVVAEGIETQEQLDFLQQSGCDYGQGFLFSRPLPPAEIDALLERKFPHVH